MLLFFSLLLELFILAHEFLSIIIFAVISVITFLTIRIIVVFLVLRYHLFLLRFGPEVSNTLKLVEISILCERSFNQG